MMRSFSLEALKNKLGEYPRLAVGGETIIVTDPGRVVAEQVPPRMPVASFDVVMRELAEDRGDRR